MELANHKWKGIIEYIRVFDLISTLEPAELIINSSRYEDFSQWLQTIHT